MRIALVVPGGVDRSGTHRVIPVILWLIERLVRAGDEVHVFALNQEAKPGRWELLGARVHNAGRRSPRLRSILNLLREHRRRRFDAVHAFWAGAPGQVACIFGLLSSLPYAVTLPGGDVACIPEIGYGAQLRLRSRVATHFVLSRAAAIVAPSKWLATEARARGWAPILCPFGVALDRWPPSEPDRRDPAAPLRLIHVASLNRVKNPFGLLDAMRALADLHVDFTLDIFGEDTLGGAVQRQCSALSLDELVKFHGFLPANDLRPQFDKADLLIMNSLNEGAPIAMLEAAVAGVPTVGTAVGYISDWAQEASVAVPVRDPAALARAVADLAGNEEKRLRIAKAAHARAIAWDANAYAAKVRAIHAEVASELRARRATPMGRVQL
jgi:glycosyltransferase involved in cell wall biosynthesis